MGAHACTPEAVMPLTTRCPHCGRLFPVYAQQIKARRNKVECPQCGRRFGAVSGLLEEQVPPSETASRRRKRTGKTRLVSASASSASLASDAKGTLSRRGRTASWSVGVLILTLALIGQAAWWERGTWMGRTQIWTTLEGVCRKLGCSVPLPRVVGSMDILRPALGERPGDPSTLTLSLTLLNTTVMAQRLPLLQLELYDKDGSLLAARRFDPDQYAAGKGARSGIAPGQTAKVALDIAALDRPPSGFRVRLF
jgi:predicted Zn finger-like uncharacterized protein